MRRRAWVLLFLLLPAAEVRPGEGEVRLLTDDAIPRYLARGRELARAKQWDKVVDVLQRVVAGDQEVFPDLKPEVLHSAVYSQDGRLFYPARELCLKELARLPPEGLRAYRDAYDLEARALFEKAKSARSLEARLATYAAVYDRYLPSSVGDDALEAAADLNLALGRYYEALALFRRLLDLYPKDTDRDLPMVLARAAFCASRIGDTQHRDVLLERLASEYPRATVRVEGKPVAVGDLKAHPVMRVSSAAGAAQAGDWPVAGGNPARSRVSKDLPLDLPRKPLWSAGLADRDPRIAAAYRTWLVSMHNREPSPTPQLQSSAPDLMRNYPTIRPVVVGGFLFYKDYLEIVERRLGPGTFVPRVCYSQPLQNDDPTFLLPADKVRPGTQGNSQEARRNEAVYRYVDYGGNSLVVAGDYIVVTESKFPSLELRTSSAGQAAHPNRLVVYGRESGKMLWAWYQDYPAEVVRQDLDELAAWQKDYQQHPDPLFYGPGVVAGGIIYTVAFEQEGLAGVSLWAIDLVTGRVRFRTPLHYADEVNKIVPRGAAVAVAGGVVYAVTHAGVVAAVDALPPGRVRWIARYTRNYERRGGRRVRGRRNYTRGQVVPGFAYNDPLVTGGKVIVAAADAKEIVALDAETGRLAWSAPTDALGKVHHIVGVSDGVLVLAGDKVIGIDVAKGEKLWGPKSLDGWPFGRGFVGERYAYVPTRHENARRSFVERFDLLTGGRETKLEFDVEKLGNLLSVDGRLIAANGDEVMCFTTYEAELARIDDALGLPGNKTDLYVGRALLALTGDVLRRDQAREDFDRALEAAAREGVADATIRVYALENLFAIARKRLDLNALDAARKVLAPLAAEPVAADEGKIHPYEAQIAIERVELLGRLGRGDEALAALEEFQDRYLLTRVVREGRVVDAEAAAAALRENLRATNTAFRTAFDKSVRGRIQAAFQAKDAAALKALPVRYGYQPPSEEAFFARATVHEERKELAAAESALREFLERFPDHARIAAAHLRLARVLAKQGRPGLARREFDDGIARLDEKGRALNRKLLADLPRLLGEGARPPPRPRLSIPLRATPLDLEGFTPVPVEGLAPGGIALFASAKEYVGVDAAGKVVWRQLNPTGTGVEPGPAGESTTLVIASQIANARFAQMLEGDVILGDLYGAMRIEPATGKVRWRYPTVAAEVRTQAQQSLDLLRADLRQVETTGHILRRHPLPAYALAGNTLLRVHPRVGIEALHAGTGKWIWADADMIGQVAVGPPSVLGGMAAVGWSKPGRVRVYSVRDGEHLTTLGREKMVVVAPPVLDPLGRIVVIHSREEDGSDGELGIFNVRGDAPALPVAYPVPASTAAVIYTDGKLLVYHDGGSGTKNLHFVDLERNRRESRRTGDMMRSVSVVQDGDRLFVLTHAPGLADEGARLFRIDLKSSDALSYDLPLKATAFSRAVLTQRYVAVAAALPGSAHVRLFDREASVKSRAPQPVFLTGGRETAELDFQAVAAARYSVPPALAASGAGLVLGHPFGVFRLQAQDARREAGG